MGNPADNKILKADKNIDFVCFFTYNGTLRRKRDRKQMRDFSNAFYYIG